MSESPGDYLRPDHPLVMEVATRYAQRQVRVPNYPMAREHLNAIPDGWAKLDGRWVRVKATVHDVEVRFTEEPRSDA